MTQVTITYLEMISPSLLKEVTDSKQLVVQEVQVKQYQLNRFLYQFIGEAWAWTDKLHWSDEQWQEFAERESLRTWLACDSGSPAGYYELEQTGNGDTEIASFGLAPKFIGKGYGAYLLSHAVSSAWAWSGTKRVWVDTCTLDHPNALNNYRSRGFEIFAEETVDHPDN